MNDSQIEVPGMSPPAAIIAAEKVVLGAAISSADRAAELGEIVTPGDFWMPAHQLILEAVQGLASRGEPVDPLAVLTELTRRGTVMQAGGGVYLHECLAENVAAASYHARHVAGDAERRSLLLAAVRIADIAASPGYDPEAGPDMARKLLDDATAVRTDTGLRSMAEIADAVIESLETEAERGITTGIADLDYLLNGLSPGQLILIAGRPGAGKSVLGAQVAHHAATKLGLPVLMTSAEMTEEEITVRLFAAEAQVNLHSLLARKLDRDDWDRLCLARQRIAESRLVIDYAPGATVAHIRARLKAMQRTAPAKLCVVDYLGLLREPGADSRQQEVAAISLGLKRLAGEFGIPVVACAQLNRNPEGRSDKKPQVSDLRDSGAQEMDADVVILLHREDLHEPESARAGEIDLIVGKNRQGPRSIVTAAFQGHYGRVVDMAPQEEPWSPTAVLERGGVA